MLGGPCILGGIGGIFGGMGGIFCMPCILGGMGGIFCMFCMLGGIGGMFMFGPPRPGGGMGGRGMFWPICCMFEEDVGGMGGNGGAILFCWFIMLFGIGGI